MTTMPSHTTTGSSVRLTSRGRTMLLLLLVAVLFAAFSFGRANSQAAPTAGGVTAPVVAETVVQPGESLWTVARRIAPDNDPREVIAQIRALNAMTTSQLLVGQHLLLPVAA